RGCHVTYVSLYGSTESSDLGQRFIHPRLEQRTLPAMRSDELLSRFAGPDRLLLLEAPAPEFTDVVAGLAAGGFTVAYDLIDDWTDPALGGDWFDEPLEKRFVEMADARVAVSPDLAARLETFGVEVTVVPNGVNASLFSSEPGPPPGDLDVARPVIGYHGSLYGDWIDWDGVREVSALGSVVMIGDARSVPPGLGTNVHFLGPKPHHSLPRYLSRFDVGLVPFQLSDTMHAVSPLKVFEYLAAGVPVAAPPLRSLAGMEGVYCAERLIDAVQAALEAPRPDASVVLEHHSWSVRLEAIYAAAGHRLGPERDGGAQVLIRPVVHYGRNQRSL
ncbi:MAG: glycosyltransferase, partial [Acidimicrobiia bacterium]|nr:glycosyltransferase [Acidimicrobiia bacterium]